MKTRLKGRLAVEHVDIGTRSERHALVLHSRGHRYVVRHADRSELARDEAAELAGRTVEATGDLHAQYFDIETWTIIDPPPLSAT